MLFTQRNITSAAASALRDQPHRSGLRGCVQDHGTAPGRNHRKRLWGVDSLFTPVQHPANDMTTSTVTTHRLSPLDHNLLKLGYWDTMIPHHDPNAAVTHGIEPVSIVPLTAGEVMSLFQSTAFGIAGRHWRCPLGVLCWSSARDFAMQISDRYQAQVFLSDLVRIAGLGHGTDGGWENAQTLIQRARPIIQ